MSSAGQRDADQHCRRFLKGRQEWGEPWIDRPDNLRGDVWSQTDRIEEKCLVDDWKCRFSFEKSARQSVWPFQSFCLAVNPTDNPPLKGDVWR